MSAFRSRIDVNAQVFAENGTEMLARIWLCPFFIGGRREQYLKHVSLRLAEADGVGPLEELKVVEMAGIGADPFCAMVLTLVNSCGRLCHIISG